ncbi:Flp family type IVb pilin [Pelagibacterium sediminicola]|uniref:Flp family type IVb pilin n=1 Tax=Pelagibacterium sediminicola TaxID=2248761 RepID=UPI000E31E393|nr:Flp family type IVb pilin [Pelagibacterium sediminicola]
MFLKFFSDENGATAIEYALIASVTSIVIIAALILINENLTGMYETVRDAVSGALGR